MPPLVSEAGIDFKLGDKGFIGLRAIYDYKSDSKFYDYSKKCKGMVLFE
jgi:hypothetical protein